MPKNKKTISNKAKTNIIYSSKFQGHVHHDLSKILDDDDYSEDEESLTDINHDILPWIEKYRPSNLDEIIAHKDIINSLRVFIDKKCLPHLLFYGPPGTGKTSTITACARELYGKYYTFMVMELNASDDRGIEVVRNKIKQFVTAKNVYLKDDVNMFKLVILDETDAMTTDAQAILRQVIEKYIANTRFCLICNYIQNIDPALQSRCTRFRFSPIGKKDTIMRVKQIVEKENIKITTPGLLTIIRRSNGDMRKVLNNLQSTSMSHKVVNEKNVNVCLGFPRKTHIRHILHNLINEPYDIAYTNILECKKTNGLTIGDILTEIYYTLVDYITEEVDNDENIKKLNSEHVRQLLDKLRVVERNQSINSTEYLQIAALIGIFKNIIRKTI